MRVVEHPIQPMIICSWILSEKLLVEALVPRVLEDKVKLPQVIPVGVDVVVFHGESGHKQHSEFISELWGDEQVKDWNTGEENSTFGKLGLVKSRGSLHHNQLAVVLESLRCPVDQGHRVTWDGFK